MWRRNPFQVKLENFRHRSFNHLLQLIFNFSLSFRKIRILIRAFLEGLQLQSRLETLKEKCDNNQSYNQEHSNFYLEEDVEVPDSPLEGDCFPSGKICSLVSTGELVSQSEDNVMSLKFSTASGAKSNRNHGSGEQDGRNMWSMVTKEADALIHLDKNVSSASSRFTCFKAENFCKGAKSKTRHRFSFGFPPHKGVSWPAISNNENNLPSKAGEVPERLKASDHGIIGHSIPELLEDFNSKEENQLELVPADVEALGHGFIEHSMAELLDGLQDNTSQLRGNSTMHRRARGKRVQASLKRSICSLGDRTIESEDLHEPFSGGSSSNDEADYLNPELAISEMKKQSISDKFQEALGATSLINEGCFIARPSGFSIGLFGKLQQVIEREKEIDTIFLKKLQNGASLKSNAL
ncbi:hypothetical protein DITRI_Ditri13aG0079600 [Diplodiscus trichospermus]